MKRKVKKLWLEALREGDYRQTRGGLMLLEGEKGASFCALGVLCDLHSDLRKSPDWDFSSKTPRYLENGTVLPERVMKWAKLKEENPTLKLKPEMASMDLPEDLKEQLRRFPKGATLNLPISVLNDYKDCSFKQIAGLIEVCL